MTDLDINILIREGKLEQAIDYFEEKSKTDQNNVSLYLNIASLYYKLSNWTKAIENYLFAKELTPNDPFIYTNIGFIYHDRRLFQEADSYFKKAVEINSFNPFFLANLASNQDALGDLDGAFKNFYRAHLLVPLAPEFLNSLAIVLGKQKKYELALFYQNKLISLNQNNPEYYYNIGLTYQALCSYNEAITSYKKSIELDSGNPATHYNLGILYLLLGNFEQGWSEYEWRNQKYLEYYNKIAKYYWNGQDLEGKTIYVHAEQGFGDTLQFARYLKLLKRKKANVVFYCQDELLDIMKNVKGYDVITSKIEFKAGFHVCLLSLPYLFKTTLKNIPNDGAYITAEKDLSEKWKKMLASIKGIKVGITWRPNKKSKTLDKRAIELEKFIPLFKIAGYNFISIQKDLTEEEKLILKTHNIPNLDPKINNFTDTAAIIENLAMVLTIDTAVTHLAGAMAKKTWVMLPKDPDWRWLLEKKDSPWYPTLRLFRQKQTGNWDDIIEEIKQNLAKMTKR